jgi:hypothetical protein
MAAEASLTFRFEWAPAPAVRSDELRATWARLEVWIGGECITLVEDQESQSARRSIYVPLYPLAEWVAFNWWLLKADARPTLQPLASRRTGPAVGRGPLLERHSVRSAGDGFCWPDLLIMPEGQVTRLAWRRDRDAPAARPVRFINQGEAVIDRQEVDRALAGLVEAVLTRLTELGISRTTLSTEWDQLLQIDPDEAEFCLAAARLGLDPYAEAAPYEADILRAADQLEGQVFEDFLNAVSPRRIGDGLEWISGARGAIENRPGPRNETVERMRTHVRGMPMGRGGQRPWELGYLQADELRRLSGIGVEEPFQLADVVEQRTHVTSDHGLKAFGAAGVSTTPIVVVGRPQPEDLSRFTLARGLWHALYQDEPHFLVTAAHTDRQKIERAFAAQLLAPAQGVAARLETSVDSIGMEDVEPIARHFRVSPLVIQNQIENQLASSVIG